MLIQQFCRCGRPKMTRESDHCQHCNFINGRSAANYKFWTQEETELVYEFKRCSKRVAEIRAILTARHGRTSLYYKIKHTRKQKAVST